LLGGGRESWALQNAAIDAIAAAVLAGRKPKIQSITRD